MTAYPGQTLPEPGQSWANFVPRYGTPDHCDTARDQTMVCSDASSTEMQCFRPLRHTVVIIQNYSGCIINVEDIFSKLILLSTRPILLSYYIT
jgi:hypothetical protein